MNNLVILGGIMILGCGLSDSARQDDKKQVKKPAVADMWYPVNKNELQNMIQKFFDNVKPSIPAENKIYGIIAPHAGYQYSGQTAATAFKKIKGKSYKTVIIIGPKHAPKSNNVPPVNFRGICTDSIHSAYSTPLGDVEIDENLVDDLISSSKLIQSFPEAFADEHSVESQIPFLQVALGNKFKIVPIIMTDHSYETCEILAEAIAKVAKNKNILIVASSDFYHGYNYETCKTSVKKASNLISKYDINAFHSAFINEELACGGAAITSTILACKMLGANKIAQLHETNSGDVTGERQGWVVGYSSFIITGDNNENNQPEEKEIGKIEFQPLDEKTQKELLKMARITIETYAKKGEILKFQPTLSALNEKRGVFVTLMTKDGDLRGCIGYHETDIPLYVLVPQMAIASGFQDYRFQPLKESELDNIKIKLSIYLTNVYEIKDTSEYQVGVHGIIMEKNGRGATFLPEVPVEQNWTKEMTLNHLALKAGLIQDAWKSGAKFYVYKTQVFGE